MLTKIVAELSPRNGKFQRVTGDRVLEGFAFEILHGDEGAAVLFTDVVDGADVRVIQSGGGFGFATEALEGLGVAGQVIWEKFEGDEAVETSLFGLVDNTHATAAEPFEDAVVRDCVIRKWLGAVH